MIQVKILINGTDVTRDLSPFLRGVSYVDELSGKTDSLTIDLADVDSRFIGDWLPERGSTLALTFINEEEELELGAFEVDELDWSTPPTVMKLKGNSCPQNSALRQVDSSRSWENCKLSDIARDIADNAGVELFYKAQDDPQITRAEQGEESALAFLDKLCRKNYLALKFSDNQIIIFDERELDNSSPALTIRRGDQILKKIQIRTTLTEIYKECEVSYRHGKKDELFKATCSDPSKSDGKTLKINRRVESQAEAEKLAENELREKNKKENSLTLNCVGDFRLLAGNVITLDGFGTFDGNWLIERATHSVGNQGYETRLEARKCL